METSADKQTIDKAPNSAEEFQEACQFSDCEDYVEENASAAGAGCKDGDDAGEGDGNSRLFNTCHPLQNHVILTRIFELSPVEDLKVFRLVCKQWYKTSLQAWRSSAVINFRSTSLKRYDNLDFFWEPEPPYSLVKPVETTNVLGYRISYLSNVQKFLTYVQIPDNDCEQKPYRQFDLFEWELKEGDEQIDQFRTICGPSITVLELQECVFNSLSGFRDALFNWFPNLKKLTIKDFKCDWSVDAPTEPTRWSPPQQPQQKRLKYLNIDLNHEQWPISWFDMFNLFPNLETFKLYNAEVDQTVQTVLKAMKLVKQQDRRHLQIKHLDLLAASLYAQDRIAPHICLLIRELQFPLESLTIDLGADKNSSSTQDILQWHAASLKKLDAYRGPISYPYPDFPFGVQMNALQELVMSDRLSETMAFIKYTPNLKKLYICDAIEDRPPVIPTDIVKNTDMAQLEGFQLEKCIELRFDYAIPTEDMEKLITCLPNLEKLRMPLNDSQFRMVCQHWKNTMRDLHILGNIPDDSTITGLSKEDVKAINDEEAAATKEELCEMKRFEDKPVHYPNITDLKELRKFQLCNEDLIPTRLMDCSAFYGFLKVPQLNTLCIASQMKDRARRALYSKISNCVVHRQQANVPANFNWDSDDSDW